MCPQLPSLHILSVTPSQLAGSFLSVLKLMNFQRKCSLNLVPPSLLKLLPYIHCRKNAFIFTTFTSSPPSNSFQPGFCPYHSSDLRPVLINFSRALKSTGYRWIERNLLQGLDSRHDFGGWVPMICKLCCQSLSCVWLFATPWTTVYQASLSFTISQSLLKLMSIESVMPSNHLILCHPLLLLPSIFPSIRVFSNELALHIRWPKYWSFSFHISPSNEYSGLISFRLTSLILLLSKGLSKVFSSTTVRKHQFFKLETRKARYAAPVWGLGTRGAGVKVPILRQ